MMKFRGASSEFRVPGSLLGWGLLLLLTLPAEAATYYVATTGDDANSGTLAQPFRTLGQGVSVLRPGDTLYVRAGTYNGVINNTNHHVFPLIRGAKTRAHLNGVNACGRPCAIHLFAKLDIPFSAYHLRARDNVRDGKGRNMGSHDLFRDPLPLSTRHGNGLPCKLRRGGMNDAGDEAFFFGY